MVVVAVEGRYSHGVDDAQWQCTRRWGWAGGSEARRWRACRLTRACSCVLLSFWRAPNCVPRRAMPAAPLALPAAEGEAAEAGAEQRLREMLLSLVLAAPPLQPVQVSGRAGKKAKEAAAATSAAEQAATTELAPLRPGDSLAVTRLKLVGGAWSSPRPARLSATAVLAAAGAAHLLRPPERPQSTMWPATIRCPAASPCPACAQDLLCCQRGLPAAALAKPLVPAAWQQAVREADSLQQLRSLLGEVGGLPAGQAHARSSVAPTLPRAAQALPASCRRASSC